PAARRVRLRDRAGRSGDLPGRVRGRRLPPRPARPPGDRPRPVPVPRGRVVRRVPDPPRTGRVRLRGSRRGSRRVSAARGRRRTGTRVLGRSGGRPGARRVAAPPRGRDAAALGRVERRSGRGGGPARHGGLAGPGGTGATLRRARGRGGRGRGGRAGRRTAAPGPRRGRTGTRSRPAAGPPAGP